jgi:hypothetical protein
MKRIILITLIALSASLVAPALTASASQEQGPDRVYFEQTGHYVGGDFLSFWRAHGGIQTFGYPLTPEIELDGIIVQYFERHVLQYHSENSGDFQILLRRLGAEARDARGLNDEAPFQPDSEADSGIFFPQTQQNMRDGFLSRWESQGGTRIFGYPISAQFRYNGTTAQFTERAIFEYHPDNPSGWRVLFERLGAWAAERDGVDTTPQAHDGETPQYHEDLWYVPEPEPEAQSFALPSQIRIDKIGVTAPLAHVGRPEGRPLQAT